MANAPRVNPLPAAAPVTDENRVLTLPWLQFFQQQYLKITGTDTFLYSGTPNQVLHGSPTLPTWSAVSLTADVTGVLPIANGGTNSSTALSGNSIAISNGTAIVQGAKGTTTTVLHGNAAGSPTYSAVSLTADVTGVLPIANGGTNSSTALSGDSIAVSNGTAIVQGAKGTTTTVLHGNAAGAPTYAGVSLTADVTGVLPIANGGTGISALGTGVATALGVNVGTAGAFVVNGGALGTPSSGTVTNLTGTASININGTVGATTPGTGAFTTVTASTSIRALAVNGYLSSDNSAGISTTVTTADLVGKTITFKDGIITAFA